MKKNKKMVLASIALATAMMINSGAYAQGQNVKQENFFESIIQKISEKFGLKKEDVKQIVDSEMKAKHETRQADIKKNAESKLTELVKAGKITENQKQLILKKQEENQAKRDAEFDSMKNLTPEQRRDAMEKNRDEMKAWATQNGIDINYLMFGGRGKN